MKDVILITKDQYQQQLNKVHADKIMVTGKFLNLHAIIMHQCNECNAEFYAKPLYLLNDNFSKGWHTCNPTFKKEKANKRTTKQEKLLMLKTLLQYNPNMKRKELAEALGLTLYTVTKYRRELGL